MVTKTEQPSSAIDTFKLMTALLVLIAGVVGFYYFEEESQLLRVLGMLAVAVVAFLIAATSEPGRRGLGFVKDARVEVRKVVWPTRQETLQTTIAVLFMVILVAIMLWLFDMFLGWSISKILA
ncbi:MAG: preprotein translocase subunit SecE [Gammaproteobacteria bacterium]|nr:preprotein translocase subunit SecE [Gammaproteobacteria bacterium]